MLARPLLIGSLLVGCGGPPPRSAEELARDGVPANSVSEARLRGDDVSLVSEVPPAAEPSSAPMPLDVSGAVALPTRDDDEPGDDAPLKQVPKDDEEKGSKKEAPGKRVSKEECSQLFDRYISLTVASDPRFADLPPDALEELKKSGLMEAARQAGDPCAKRSVTRAQHTCAIAAKSTSAWERCLK